MKKLYSLTGFCLEFYPNKLFLEVLIRVLKSKVRNKMIRFGYGPNLKKTLIIA